MSKVDLTFNVYHHNYNGDKIETVNILGYNVVKECLKEIRKDYKKYSRLFAENGACTYKSNVGEIIEFPNGCNFKDVFKRTVFEERFRSTLMYYFWGKCQCEVVITDWPTHITSKELDRLKKEDVKYGVSINLETAKKIDMYEQVMNNWQLVLDYVWNNLENANLT